MSAVCILRTQKLAMEILGFVNMNKTERITYAFNMRAPGGRYYKWDDIDFDSVIFCLLIAISLDAPHMIYTCTCLNLFSHLIRFVRAYSHVTDLNKCYKFLIGKLFKQRRMILVVIFRI